MKKNYKNKILANLVLLSSVFTAANANAAISDDGNNVFVTGVDSTAETHYIPTSNNDVEGLIFGDGSRAEVDIAQSAEMGSIILGYDYEGVGALNFVAGTVTLFDNQGDLDNLTLNSSGIETSVISSLNVNATNSSDARIGSLDNNSSVIGTINLTSSNNGDSNLAGIESLNNNGGNISGGINLDDDSYITDLTNDAEGNIENIDLDDLSFIDSLTNENESTITTISLDSDVSTNPDFYTITTLTNSDSGIGNIDLYSNSKIETLSNIGEAGIGFIGEGAGVNLYDNSSIDYLENSTGSFINVVSVNDNSSIGELRNRITDSYINYISVGNIEAEQESDAGYEITTLTNENKAEIGDIYVNNSSIETLTNKTNAIIDSINIYGYDTEGEVDESIAGAGFIETLNNNSNATIQQIYLDAQDVEIGTGEAYITTLNNTSTGRLVDIEGNDELQAGIEEIYLEGASYIGTLNNNGGTIDGDLDLDENSANIILTDDSHIGIADNSATGLINSNAGVIGDIELNDFSYITNLTNTGTGTEIDDIFIFGDDNEGEGGAYITVLNNTLGAEINDIELNNDVSDDGVGNASITTLNNNDNSIIDDIDINSFDGSVDDIASIVTLNNTDTALIDTIDLYANGSITTLTNTSFGEGSDFDDNNGIDRISLNGESHITTLINDGGVATGETAGATIDTINVNDDTSDLDEMSFFGLDMTPEITKLENKAGGIINEINVNGFATIGQYVLPEEMEEGDILDIIDPTTGLFNTGATINTINVDGDSGDEFTSASISNLVNSSAGTIGDINTSGRALILNVSNSSDSTIDTINVDEDSFIYTINNDGVIGLDDMDASGIFLFDSNNEGGSPDINELNNSSTGIINGGVNLDDNAGIFELNNEGVINDGVNLSYITDVNTDNASIFTLNNSGIINDGINLDESTHIGEYGQDDSGLYNSGTINDGITLLDNSYISNLTNSGTINGTIYVDVSGEGAGIGSLNNSGTIMSDGEGPAIVVDGSNGLGEINNNGSIIGGDEGTAIDFGGTDGNNLNINAGSSIFGEIEFGGGEGNTINVGAGAQTTSVYSYSGSDVTVNGPNDENILVVSNGDNLVVIDKGSFVDAAAQNSIRASTDIGNLILNRLNNARLEQSGLQVAQAETSRNSDAGVTDLGMKGDSRASIWSEVFGSYQERSSDRSTGDSETTTGGVIIGMDSAVGDNDRVGAFIGALDGETDVEGGFGGNTVSRNIDSQGLFAGGYYSNNMDSNFVDLSLIAGVVEHDSSRLVNDLSGTARAESSYNNVFFTPAVTVGANLEAVPMTASFTLRYTGQWIESSHETGVTDAASIETDSRYLNTGSARIQFESGHRDDVVSGGKFNFRVRAGVEANKEFGDNSVDATVLGQNVTIDANERDYNVDGFVGLSTSYDAVDSVRLYADVEGSKGLSNSLSSNELGIYGKVGVKYRF